MGASAVPPEEREPGGVTHLPGEDLDAAPADPVGSEDVPAICGPQLFMVLLVYLEVGACSTWWW